MQTRVLLVLALLCVPLRGGVLGQTAPSQPHGAAAPHASSTYVGPNFAGSTHAGSSGAARATMAVQVPALREPPSSAIGAGLSAPAASRSSVPSDPTSRHDGAGVPSHDRFVVASDGVRLHVTEAGPANGRTLLFVPGWTMPAWIFAPQIQAFSRQ